MIFSASSVVTFLLLGASLSSAAAVVPRAPANGDFAIRQVRNPNFVRRSVPDEMMRLRRKYGSRFGANTDELERRDGVAGTVLNKPAMQGAEYIIPVQIGTPPQTIWLDLDTGSSDLWTMAETTPAKQLNGQILYYPSKSTTATALPGALWNITYGDGSTSSGHVIMDTVTVGGVTVASQAVEVADTVSEEFSTDPASSGLFGMALTPLNTVLPKIQNTFYDNVKASLTSQVFTADLRQNTPGTYGFGFINSSLYSGVINYTPVQPVTNAPASRNDNFYNPGFWMVNSTGYSVGATSTQTIIPGIADTGTTLLLLPLPIVQAYFAGVKSATYNSQYDIITFDCSAATTLPSFSLLFGANSAPVTIPPAYMNAGPLTTNSPKCVAGMQPSTGIGINIFGDVFLKATYAVFDIQNLQIGFANKVLVNTKVTA